MHVVRIDPNTLADLQSHEGEAFRSQTIRSTRIAALSPFGPLKVYPVEQRQRVHAISEGYSAASRSAVRMIVVCVERSMVVEVLLNMNDGVIVLRELRADGRSVRVLVTRDVVTVEEGRKTSDIETGGIEDA